MFELTGKATEVNYSNINFNNGDKVKCIITNILPISADKESIDKKLELNPGADWKTLTDFKNGIMYIVNILAKETDNPESEDKWEPLVAVSEDGNFIFPKGKFGLQVYHGIRPSDLFGKDGAWPFRFDVSIKDKPAQYELASMPNTWDSETPEARFEFWQKMAAAALKVGEKKPEVINAILQYQDMHKLDIGDKFTALIYKSKSKTTDKWYTYLKSLVKKPDGKWEAKKEYDLEFANNDKTLSAEIAGLLYEAINKQEEKSGSFTTEDGQSF